MHKLLEANRWVRPWIAMRTWAMNIKIQLGYTLGWASLEPMTWLSKSNR